MADLADLTDWLKGALPSLFKERGFRPDGQQSLGEVGEFKLLAHLLIRLAYKFTRGVGKILACRGKFYRAHWAQSTVNNLWLAQTTPAERDFQTRP